MKRGEIVKKVLSDEQRERYFAEEMWLRYFNQYLFDSGTITEKEYKKMTEKIVARMAKLSGRKGRTCKY